MNASVARTGFFVMLAGILFTLTGCDFFGSIAEEGFMSAFYWWQIPVVFVLIALIFFWKKYRNKQM